MIILLVVIWIAVFLSQPRRFFWVKLFAVDLEDLLKI